MNEEAQKKRYEPYKIVIFVASLAALIAILYNIREVFACVTIAIFFAYILDPVAMWLYGRKIGKRITISWVAAVTIAFLLGILVVTAAILIMIPAIADQVQRFSENMPAYTQKADETLKMLQARYHRLELPPAVQANVTSSFNKIIAGSSSFLKGAAGVAGHFFSQIVLILLIPFLTFYMLVERNDVKSAIVGVFPKKFHEETGQIVTEASHAFRGYIFCKLLLSIVMMVGMSTCLGLMGVKAPLLLGIIAGIAIMIPIIGVFFACIPAAFVALSSSTSLAIWVIIIFSSIQLLETKVITPLFFSKYVNLSPLTILLALVVGEQLGGILGMFISTPVAAILHVVYIHLRKRYD
ncbi:MAG: AI-2E family transporter [bacterium]